MNCLILLVLLFCCGNNGQQEEKKECGCVPRERDRNCPECGMRNSVRNKDCDRERSCDRARDCDRERGCERARDCDRDRNSDNRDMGCRNDSRMDTRPFISFQGSTCSCEEPRKNDGDSWQ